MNPRMVAVACLSLLAMSFSGCVGDVVLPKTFDLSVEYAEADEQSASIHGLEYVATISDPNGTEIFRDEGVIEEGFSRDAQIVFEEVGPYTLEVGFSHPEHGTKSFEKEFDFKVLCRSADHVTVDIVYQAGELDVDMEGGGPLCKIPDSF